MTLDELDEMTDFVAGGRGEIPVGLEQVELTAGELPRGRLVEEFPHVHLEDFEDPKEGFEADLVLSGLHAAEIRLLDPHFRCQLRLRELVVLAELADAPAYERELLPREPADETVQTSSLPAPGGAALLRASPFRLFYEIVLSHLIWWLPFMLYRQEMLDTDECGA